MTCRLAVFGSLLVGLASGADGQVENFRPDFREDWELATVSVELEKLPVAHEAACSRSTVAQGWQDTEPHIEILHGGLYSPYDGLCFPNFHYVEIEHIVARKEADRSGLCNRTVQERREFAADVLNLTFAPGSLNASKGDDDAAAVASSAKSMFRDELTDSGRCFWIAQTVRVKSKYDLSVDPAEKRALAEALTECRAAGLSGRRPQAPLGCGLAIRPEFLLAASAVNLAPPAAACVEKREFPSWHPAVRYVSEIACVVDPPESKTDSPTLPPQDPSPGQPDDPRAGQIAAQAACKAKLERISCSRIKAQCPSVTVIRRGEPLYQPPGTNGGSNDSDNDGLYCESL